jgi:endonuclease/exonuclease/phosphatase family metal-dependent hydrolase
MPKPLKTLFLAMGVIALAGLLFAAGFIVFLSVTEFLPQGRIVPAITGRGEKTLRPGKALTFLTWNTGYAGLGKGMNFYYDGGTRVRPGKDESARFLEGIKNLLVLNDSVDFIFLQEIDAGSKRSWNTDQVSVLANSLPGFCRAFTPNYDCRYVPVPVKDPMGRVKSGIATFAKGRPDSVLAGYFPRLVSWPRRLVYPKRCYLLMRYELGGGKDLVVINTHNSDFDSSGLMRRDELALLNSVMTEEYRRGNYVVAGGDWNNNPRGFDPSCITSGDAVIRVMPEIDPEFVPGWQFVFDPSEPTNRNVDIAYLRGITRTTVIDFFVVSPNLEVKLVKTLPTGFSCSDHQPVVMEVELRE